VDDDLPVNVEPSSISLDHTAARYNLKEAFEACKSLKFEHKPPINSQAQFLSTKKHSGEGEMELDFTPRNGTPSNLECPFAKRTNGNLPDVTIDPIAAEFHGDGSIVSGTAYAQQNPNKCPIRYLDQHSPEEVTKYFENHKHEIPRSHAVCVSRYQQNDAKIRQLDAKYGNLQNMIQSLGVKHQQYLPAKDGEQDVQGRSSQPAAVAVEKWAENVSQKSKEPVPPVAEHVENDAEEESVERTHHSETPLREIRLGESPSRPWGISVPFAQKTAASAVPSEKGIEPLSLDRTEGSIAAASEGQKKGVKTAARCPFDHEATKEKLPNGDGVPEEPSPTKGNTYIKDPSQRPPMIFNGPVFFGYSSEQATTMIQSGVFNSGKR
jgi:hypothetical protein